MSQPDNSQLLRFITDNFGLEDLKTLCFNLGVEFDDLGGEGREAKARELVKWLQNRSRLDHLIDDAILLGALGVQEKVAIRVALDPL